jgi:hypothetical protein
LTIQDRAMEIPKALIERLKTDKNKHRMKESCVSSVENANI